MKLDSLDPANNKMQSMRQQNHRILVEEVAEQKHTFNQPPCKEEKTKRVSVTDDHFVTSNDSVCINHAFSSPTVIIRKDDWMCNNRVDAIFSHENAKFGMPWTSW